jgi:hypothetical protein
VPLRGRHPCPKASSVVDDVVEVRWIGVILPLPVALSYPPMSETLNQVSVSTGERCFGHASPDR